MKEVQFLKLHGDNWKRFEAQLANDGSHPDPDKLAELFVEVTDDLSYAQTYFPDSPTARYLNDLAVQAHQKLYKNKKERGSRFIRFWTTDVPLAAYRIRKPLFYSLLIFILAILIGALSQARDETKDFATAILGPGYVDMTERNIANGDPMGVYKETEPFLMWGMIAVNNTLIALYVFGLGILFSIGTAWILFSNGVMLGVFQYFFIERGLFLTSALSIYIHGALELSAIVLAGGAGIALGSALLFPGTYSRRISLMRAGRNGGTIMVSLVPIFILAAFLESFVTRHTEMPAWLSLFIIFGSLAFIAFYYVIYPFYLKRKLNDQIQNYSFLPEADLE